MAKPRSIPVVPRDVPMSSCFHSREKSDSESPGDVKVGQDCVRTSIWQRVANTSPYAAEQSQESRPESIEEINEGCWKQEQKGESSHSISHWQRAECWEKMKEILVP